MSIRDGHYRKVSFDTREELGVMIDKLAVMIGKLATRDGGTNRQFKPQIHQSTGRGQNRNYNQRNYQDRYRANNRSIAEKEDNTEKKVVGLDTNKSIEEVILEET